MPGPLKAGDKLGDSTVTLNQKMCGYPQVGDPLKVGMLGDIQTILEKRLHLASGELRRRQADVVDHQQGNFIRGARIEVGRGAYVYALAPTARGVQLHTGSFNDDRVGAQYAAIDPLRAITCRD